MTQGITMQKHDSLRRRCRSVSAGDKVTGLCMDMDGNIIAVEATAEDSGLYYKYRRLELIPYLCGKGDFDRRQLRPRRQTSAKSPKTGGER